jgi:hypothetical protein
MTKSWLVQHTSVSSTIVAARRGSSSAIMQDLDTTNVIWRPVGSTRPDPGVRRAARPDHRGQTDRGEDRNGCEIIRVDQLAALRRAHREPVFLRSVVKWPAPRSLARRPCCCRSIGPCAAVEQAVRASCQRSPIAMIQIAPHRSLSWVIAYSDVMQWEVGDTSTDGKIKRVSRFRNFVPKCLSAHCFGSVSDVASR